MKRRNLAAVAGQLWRAVFALATRSANAVKKRSLRKLITLFRCTKAALYSIRATLSRCAKIVTKKFHV